MLTALFLLLYLPDLLHILHNHPYRLHIPIIFLIGESAHHHVIRIDNILPFYRGVIQSGRSIVYNLQRRSQ